MGIARIAALIVIVAGIAALVYGGFSYTTESTAAKLGPLELKVKEENRVNIPVWAGVAAIVAGGLVLLVWITMAAVFRYSSLAALTASLAAPQIQVWGWGLGPATVGTAIMSALLIWRHEANIRKLLAGQESKLGQKASGG